MLNSATPILSRQPLGFQIADRLRREILFGILGPDDHLTQESICQRFDTSRIPVRDAIRTLVQEGFLRSVRARVQVVPISERDLDDMFRIEGTLHALATALATERASEEQVAELAGRCEQIDEAIASGDSVTAAQMNASFHREINRLAGSARVLAALRATSVKIDGEYLHHFPEHGEASSQEHNVIVEAMRAHDPQGASEAMLAHVLSGAQELHANLVQARAGAMAGGQLDAIEPRWNPNNDPVG